MNKEEILQYNKRCAEFLGWKETSEQFKMDWVGCKTKERLEKINEDYIPILEKDGDVIFPDFAVRDYVNDWNWIMEVVEAIEKLDSFYVQIEESACYIYDISKFTDEQCNPFISCDLRLNSKKEAVVQAINQFLIWYNNGKTN